MHPLVDYKQRLQKRLLGLRHRPGELKIRLINILVNPFQDLVVQDLPARLGIAQIIPLSKDLADLPIVIIDHEIQHIQRHVISTQFLVPQLAALQWLPAVDQMRQSLQNGVIDLPK